MQALSKALTEDELVYLRAQFSLLEPNGDGSVSLDNFRMVTAFSISINISSIQDYGIIIFL
jgi:Ca2+-binding EF-hand superfamily protein